MQSFITIRSGLNFEVFQMKRIYYCLHESIGCKSEFGFDTGAAIRRSVAKLLSELLHPILSWRANLYFYKKPQNSNTIGILLFLTTLFLISCGETGLHNLPSHLDNPPPSQQMDPEERALIVTNDLFAAIIDHQSQETIEAILSTPGQSLLSLNKKGDTPLGVAIQFRRQDLALFFLEKLHCKDLYHQNEKGESYIYLAAHYGYHELIHQIANKCYERKKTWTSLYDYEFSDLDPKTLEGERAVHTAQNFTVMEALKDEYWRGMMEYPWRTFYKKNNNGETFFHTAAGEGRASVLEWGVQTFCHENSWEQSEHLYQSIPTDVGRYTWHIAQTYLIPFVYVTQLINFRDGEENTALHSAAKSHNLEVIQLISSCRWTDYNLENSLGNNALQEFLKSLDPTIKNHNEEIKDILIFLTKQKTHLKPWSHMGGQVNHQNEEGDSALHLAAHMADEFFYNHLKDFGDIYLPNKQGQIPKTIFETTQAQLQE